jgi:hypothetical protein
MWGSWPDIYYYLTVTVLFFCGVPSLTRGRVCLLYIASVIFLRIESLSTRDNILLSQIWDFLFVASYYSQVHGGGIRPRLHTGGLNIIRAEQRSSLLPATSQHGHSWHRAPLGLMAIYLFSVKTFVFFSSCVVPDIYYCLTVTVLFLWGALSDDHILLSPIWDFPWI